MMPTLILLSDDDGMHELVTTGIFPSSLSVSAKIANFAKIVLRDVLPTTYVPMATYS